MDHKELLVTGNFLYPLIEQGKAIGDFKQAFRLAQAINQPVLFRHYTLCLRIILTERRQFRHRENPIFIFGRDLFVNRSFDFLILDFKLVPKAPELFGSPYGGISRRIHTHREKRLAKNEQSRNIFVALIANHLGNALFDSFFGRLILDDCKRDSVHKQHDIRDNTGIGFRAFHIKFGNRMEHIVRRFLPVDIANVVTALVALDRFLFGLRERKQVIYLCIRTHQTIVLHVLEFQDGIA